MSYEFDDSGTGGRAEYYFNNEEEQFSVAPFSSRPRNPIIMKNEKDDSRSTQITFSLESPRIRKNTFKRQL